MKCTVHISSWLTIPRKEVCLPIWIHTEANKTSSFLLFSELTKIICHYISSSLEFETIQHNPRDRSKNILGFKFPSVIPKETATVTISWQGVWTRSNFRLPNLMKKRLAWVVRNLALYSKDPRLYCYLSWLKIFVVRSNSGQRLGQ